MLIGYIDWPLSRGLSAVAISEGNLLEKSKIYTYKHKPSDVATSKRVEVAIYVLTEVHHGQRDDNLYLDSALRTKNFTHCPQFSNIAHNVPKVIVYV